MSYIEKSHQWWDKLINRKGGGIECIGTTEKGRLWYRDINGIIPVDNLFFCQKENGSRTAEIIYRNDSDNSIDSKERIFIKDMEKIIFIDKNGEEHGFGYNKTDKAKSFVLYIRIGGNARLMWGSSACDKVNCAVEVNPDNPTDLDCLAEFFQRSNDTKQTENKDSEV